MNQGTHLLRQVNPGFIRDGKITSQVFRPTSKDNSKLSLYNGDLISPEDAFAHFTEQPECKSIGIVAVIKAECDDEDLPIIEDGIPFPEHCTLDFTGLAKSMIKQKATFLKNYAEKRGWLHQVE
jgi:hypothetical protein